MPSNPSLGDVHVNAPLTNISIAYIQNAKKFVAGQVFPVIPSMKQSDRYYAYPKGDWFRQSVKLRAPASESAGSGWTLTNTSNFFCDVYAIHKDVDDQIRSNADPVINMDRDATEWCTQQMLIKRDTDFVTKFFSTSIWTGSSTGTDLVPGTLWSAGGSTPISDIRAQIFYIEGQTGFRPNTLVLGALVWQKLIDHPDFLDRIQFGVPGNPSMVAPELLAAVLEIDKVVIARSVSNTAVQGATDSIAFILGKNALLCYSNPSPSILTPSAGYIFSWTGLLGAGAQGNRISTFRMEWLKADRIEAEMSYDMKVVAPELGAFWNGAVA